MKSIRIILALIGLCALVVGQTTTSTSTSTFTGTPTTGILSVGTGAGLVMSGPCAGCVMWTGGDPMETRSAKVPGPTLREVKASAHKIPMNQLPTASYLKTAKAVGLDSPAIAEAQLAQIIVDHGFSIYDYSNVDNYLYHEALKQGTQVRWVWKPMRTADMKAAAQETWSTWDGMGRISAASMYARALPEKVLAKVECLMTELPDAIFLVSDYEVVKPDPFLAVTTPKMLSAHRIFIVDQWDEPGFTDKPIVKPYDEDKVLQKEIVRASPKSRQQSLAGN